MKLYFIPVIVFLTSLNNSQNTLNKTPITVVWVSESVDEQEFTVEELLYETSFESDSLQSVKQRKTALERKKK